MLATVLPSRIVACSIDDSAVEGFADSGEIAAFGGALVNDIDWEPRTSRVGSTECPRRMTLVWKLP